MKIFSAVVYLLCSKNGADPLLFIELLYFVLALSALTAEPSLSEREFTAMNVQILNYVLDAGREDGICQREYFPFLSTSLK